jgi:signal transduction histidine kinase
LRLINNVLDLAKIEAGRMELALADYSVQDTVESVRSTLRPLAAEKGLEFVVTGAGGYSACRTGTRAGSRSA